MAPQVGDEEKALIRELLPRGLSDPVGKIRLAAAMAIASVAAFDWPEAWPELTGTLVCAIRERRSAECVHGALRCLALLADDLEESSLPVVVPALWPQLYALVADDCGASLARRALQVLHACLQTLAYASGAQAAPCRALMAPYVPGWLAVIARVLSQPLRASDAHACGLQMEALRVLMKLLTLFPPKDAALGSDAAHAVAAVWGLLQRSHEAYQACCVEGDGEGEECGADSDGEELSLEALVAQLLELLLLLVGNGRFAGLVEPHLPSLLPLLLGLMRMTAAQEARWASSPQEFEEDEDEDCSSVRAVCEMLLDELLAEMPGSAAPALTATAVEAMRCGPAHAARPRGWWKAREAALLALGSTAERFMEPGAPSGGPDYAQLVRDVLSSELHPGAAAASAAPPLLAARALWAATRCARCVPLDSAPALLDAIAAALAPGAHPLLRAAAARAAAAYIPVASADGALAPRAPRLFALLGGVLAAHGEEAALGGALEALRCLARAQPGCAAGGAQALAPPLLGAWAAHFNDPLLAPAAAEAAAALVACSPEAARALHGAALPQLRCVFLEAAASVAPPGLLASALELAHALVGQHRGGDQASRAAHAALFAPALALAAAATDAAVVGAACTLLRDLLRGAGEQLPAWGCDGQGAGDAVGALLELAALLLQRGGEDEDCAVQAGPLLLALLRRAPTTCLSLLPRIAAACAQRIRCARTPALAASLLRVFALLAHEDCAALVDMLAGCSDPAVCGDDGSALATVLRAWTVAQADVHGASALAHTTTALALLATCAHPALQRVICRGERVDALAGEATIRTRSRARQAGPEQYAAQPAPQALLALCADALLEAQEAAALDDEWSTDEEDEEETRGRGSSGQRLGKGLGGDIAALMERGGGAGLWPDEEAEGDSDEADDALTQTRDAVPRFVGEALRQAAADPARAQMLLAHARALNPRRQQALQQAMQQASAS